LFFGCGSVTIRGVKVQCIMYKKIMRFDQRNNDVKNKCMVPCEACNACVPGEKCQQFTHIEVNEFGSSLTEERCRCSVPVVKVPNMAPKPASGF
jgi:hypothetical protein